MHSCRIDGLHRQRGIAVEAIVVLHWRLVLRVSILESIVMPGGTVVFEGLLVVVVLVVHLHLAHAERQ